MKLSDIQKAERARADKLKKPKTDMDKSRDELIRMSEQVARNDNLAKIKELQSKGCGDLMGN